MTLFKRLADTLSGSGKRERYAMSFITTKNRIRNFYCIDCLEQHKSNQYEIKRAGGVRCESFGGNVVKKSELTEPQLSELKHVQDDKFPKHELKEQPDGTWKSEPMIFHVSRWPGKETKP